MIDFRPVLLIVGWLICVIGGAMVIPAIVDYATGSSIEPFLIASACAFGLGGALILANHGPINALTLRQAYVLTALSWVAATAIAALPLVFSDLQLSYTDAFFETMSGFTTTGSTVLVGLDDMLPGILLWRGLLQWMGGIGIIGMAIAILPMLRSGGMQLFKAESSDRSDKLFPRITHTVTALTLVYGALTLFCALGYRLAGMSGFDAVVHAMTTLSTGGFSTRDLSIGSFDAAVQWVSVVFMLLGSMPFVLFVRMLRGDWSLFFDGQIRVMLGVVSVSTFCLALWLVFQLNFSIADALRVAATSVAAILSTTGFACGDYTMWGGFAVGSIFLLMFAGGCTGSTAGAIKIFRFQVMWIILVDHLYRRFQPHAVRALRYDQRELTLDVIEGVMAFILVYGLSVGLGGAMLAVLGLDWQTSLSGAATALGNVGPGIGPIIGPVGSFKDLPDAAKWILSFGMLLGRLELFTVLVLFLPRFWRG